MGKTRLAVELVPSTMTGSWIDAPSVPLDSLVFGYGPMLPLVAAAVGSWLLAAPLPGLAIVLAIIWGALVLSFSRAFDGATASATGRLPLAPRSYR